VRHQPPVQGKRLGVGPRRSSRLARVAGWWGLTAHGLLGVPYLLSGLFAPLWAAVILWTVWTGLLVLAIQQHRRRPMLVALTPIMTLLTWFGALWAGTALLGWAA
jgi:hypothetical protein